MKKKIEKKLKRPRRKVVKKVEPIVEPVVEKVVEPVSVQKDFRLNVEGVREPQERMTEDSKRTGRIINAEPTVRFYFPLGIGEPFGVEQSVKINGYHWLIKKGMSIDLPETVCAVLQDRINSETGRNMPEHQEDRGEGFGAKIN